ncbi:MAG: helix-turn-helix transcriptional regulator [Prevotella sp.]|jgi:transcriptional regulator with XRE-family HTH domain|nr:helix-turn-helix transcriptional regulator [Prevotella sp.]
MDLVVVSKLIYACGATVSTIARYMLITFYDKLIIVFKIISTFVKIFLTDLGKMKNSGDRIRELREGRELPLRVVAAYLDIDQAIPSRIERGQRKASREHIIKLAEFFNVNENELLVAWLSDKIVYELADEQNAIEALKVAEEKVKYQITK